MIMPRLFHVILFAIVACCATISPLRADAPKTIRDFGAIGDGQADDTAAIQRAVDAGGGVVFPHGTYKITGTVTIDLQKTGFVSLIGDGTASIVHSGSGPAFHFIGNHAGSADPKTMKPDVWLRQRMPVVRGLEILGDHAEADGIEATGVVQLTVSETLIRKCRHAVHLTQRNRNIILTACHFYENRGCGVFYDHVSLHQSNIVGCHISYNAMGGVVFRGGDVRNVHIGTCDLESNMSPDTPPTANVLLDCTDGSTAEVAITGCTLQHNSKSPGSANIRVLGRGVGPKDTVTQEGHITITGNVFSDVMVNVHLKDVRGVSMTGNTFWQALEHDVLVENSQAVVIASNDLDRNPRYVIKETIRGGVVLRDCNDCKLSGLIVKGAIRDDAAIVLERCTRTTVTDCSIFDNDCVGLRLKDCKRCLVTGCLIRDDRTESAKADALVVDGGGENWIRGNEIAGEVTISKNSATVDGR
jgi:parallel beta-helix repeat protein